MITEQGYIPQLVRCFEEEGVRPVPIFINGIEAHTVVSHHVFVTIAMTLSRGVAICRSTSSLRGYCR